MQRQQPMMPAQYRQPPNHPHNAAQRPPAMARGPGQMMPQPGGPQYGQMPPQQRPHQQRGHHPPQHNPMRPAEHEQVMREQQARNKAERPTDLTLPEGLDDVVLGDGVAQYKKLRDFEKRLDALMMRKDMEYQDQIKKRSRQTRRMRIWISNTVEGQFWQGQSDGFDFSSDNNPTIKVRIHGELLPEAERTDTDLDGLTDVPIKASRTRFSHFFNKITVEFDQAKELAPDGTTAVEWTKPQGFHPTDPELPLNVDFDHFVFERKGDENVNININLYRDYSFGDGDESDAVYEVSDELAWIVMEKEATRDEVIERLFDYIKQEGLQQDDERRMIQCDERLRNIFQQPHIAFPQLPMMLLDPKLRLLQPLRPLSLKYTVRTDELFHKDPRPTVYEVLVPAEDLLRERLMAIRDQNPDWVHDMLRIKELDRQQALLVQALHHRLARWKFFRSAERDPVMFLRRWASSQHRDFEVILGDSATETAWRAERARRGVPGAPGGPGGAPTAGPGGAQQQQQQPQQPQVPTLRHNYDLPGDEFRRGGDASLWTSQNVREAVQLRLARGSKIKGAD